MKLYLIGGLGADKRVFKHLELPCETQFIEWEVPEPAETIAAYAKRLLGQVDQTENFGFLGVSFGGIIAIEMAKLSCPMIVILVSSVATDDQLPKKYISLGRAGLLSILPDSLLKPPGWMLDLLFGAKNKSLLEKIIKDTEPSFIRWALKQIIRWRNTSNGFDVLRIHGTHDALIPLKGDAVKIDKGTHFIIVDRAVEVNEVIEKYLRR